MTKDNDDLDIGKLVAQAVKSVVEEVLPSTLAATIQAVQAMQPKPAISARQDPTKSVRCHDCGQMQGACKGEHEELIIFPKEERWAKDFEGCSVNGIWYKSRSPGHRVTVPKKNDIMAQLQRWEANEMDMRLGKKKQRVSGRLGPNGLQANPLNPGDYWR